MPISTTLRPLSTSLSSRSLARLSLGEASAPRLSRSFHPVLPPPRPPPKAPPPPPRPAKASTSARVMRPVSSSTLPSGSTSTMGTGAVMGGAAGAAGKKPPSRHMVWYREIVPAMVPILLLSTTVFLTLSLTRTHLSHARSLSESNERIAELEAELQRLRVSQIRLRERERKERERILPMVVERVLQKVGAMGGEKEEEQPLLV